MMHPENQRRAYLQAMGVDVWLPRHAVESDDGMDDNADASPIAELDWDALRQCVASCTQCVLSKSRTQTVFGVGAEDASWMIVGEAPGADEDRCGEPFVGRAGQMLNEMLRAVGLKRESVFIANVLKCRPPNNRDPAAAEAAACRGFLERQIALLKPSVILAVGKIAAQNLLQSDEPVGRMRGRQYELNGVPLIVTYHPAYLLRSPSQKRKVWEDLCRASHASEGAVA